MCELAKETLEALELKEENLVEFVEYVEEIVEATISCKLNVTLVFFPRSILTFVEVFLLSCSLIRGNTNL